MCLVRMPRIGLHEELAEDIEVEVHLAEAGDVGRHGGGLAKAPHHGDRTPHTAVCRAP